ncbi:MAG: hypothetical protein ABIW84_02220 [Ilumatobacteraceae bacterium]
MAALGTLGAIAAQLIPHRWPVGAVRLIRVGLAWPLIALGVALLIEANLGVAPFDVLNTGVAETLDAPFSIVYPCVALIFFSIGALLGGKIGWASVLGTLVIGPLIGLFTDLTPEPDRIVVRAAMVVVATLVLATAICLVITAELGAGPSEVLMLGLVNHNMALVYARWISDGVPLVVGASLGGAVGVGTVLFALALAPLIKYGLTVLHYEPPHQRTKIGAHGPSDIGTIVR